MKKIFIALTAIALFISCKNENKSESIAEVTTSYETRGKAATAR